MRPPFKWAAEARDFFVNEIVGWIPLLGLRLWIYALLGVRFEDRGRTLVMMHNELIAPSGISLGAGATIGRHCILDGRAALTIGRHVNIGGRSQFFTGTHVIDSPDFVAEFKPITVEDHAWIAAGVIVLPGVTIGRGAVVAAGSVVSRDLAPMGVYAGVPAKQVGERDSTLEYELSYRPNGV